MYEIVSVAREQRVCAASYMMESRRKSAGDCLLSRIQSVCCSTHHIEQETHAYIAERECAASSMIQSDEKTVRMRERGEGDRERLGFRG